MGKLVANGSRLQISLKPQHSVGRGPEADLRLLYQEVSSNHALIQFHEGHWFVMDLQSSNGTVVNKRAVPPQTWVALKEGDQLSFGHVEISYQLIDAGPPEG